MFIKCLKIVCCISFICLFCILPTYGQKNDCKLEKDKNGNDVIVCNIVENNPYPLGPVRISNDRKALVRITNKSPFDECNLAEIKLTEIKEPDPIETILKFFTQAATGSKLATAGGVIVVPGVPVTLAERLLADTAKLASDLDIGINKSDELINGTPLNPAIQKPLVERINTFVSTPPRSVASFSPNGDNLIRDLEIEIQNSEDSSLAISNIALEHLLIESQSRYDAIREQVKVISNDPKASDVIRTLSLIAVKLAAFKTNYESVTSARSLFKTVIKILKNTKAAILAGKDPFSQDLAFLPYNQQMATTNASCTNVLSKKLVTPQIPITFLYKSDPNLSVSVGPLLSTTAKQKLGTTTINTGLNSSGATTFRSEFAIVDQTSYQIVPFSFINYRLFQFRNNLNPVKPSPFSLNFSAGIGVNPNSGSNEVEYFIGPAFGYKKYLIQFGDHIGRFQEGFTGGFNIGDTVPASFPSNLPIRKVYKHGFGIAFSYRLF